jgi:signal transduction histidine kinase
MAVMRLLRRGRSVLFDLLVAGGVFALTSLGIFMRETPRPTMWLGYVMTVAVLGRRRWPLVTMAVVSLAALTQVILFPPADDPLPYDLAVLVAMYSVVKYARRMWHAYLAAAVVATGIVIEVVRHFGPSWWALAIFYVGVCGGVWLVGYTVRNRHRYIATLEERAATLEREREHLARIAVADERAAIARELHDVVAHSLAVMIVQADGGRYAFERDPRAAHEALSVVAATGREALEDMRLLVGLLRGAGTGAHTTAGTAAHTTAGTAAHTTAGTMAGTAAHTAAEVPEPPDRRRITLDQLDSLLDRARSAGLTVALDTVGVRPALPPAVELTVYRSAQEALTNVLRHAGPGARVTMTLGYSAEAVSLSIVDDGGGRLVNVGAPGPGAGPVAEPDTRPVAAGHGLVGMRERIGVHGGQMSAGHGPDGGWRLAVTVPLREPVA